MDAFSIPPSNESALCSRLGGVGALEPDKCHSGQREAKKANIPPWFRNLAEIADTHQARAGAVWIGCTARLVENVGYEIGRTVSAAGGRLKQLLHGGKSARSAESECESAVRGRAGVWARGSRRVVKITETAEVQVAGWTRRYRIDATIVGRTAEGRRTEIAGRKRVRVAECIVKSEGARKTGVNQHQVRIHLKINVDRAANQSQLDRPVRPTQGNAAEA